jgi:diaminohydroxyphosphoribosylaminopyrimidine deaminase/5-amino-6-(5-phosphoribosylamino)uracil reductase
MVYGMRDPNPQVNGKGFRKLRAAGIQVEGAVLEKECRALNPVLSNACKLACLMCVANSPMSLDGRTAMASGESQWITGQPAREDVQLWRAQSDAIITGVNTILHDDPALTVRSDKLDAAAKEKQLLRVILDRKNRTPKAAKVFQQPGETLVINNSDDLKSVLKMLGDKQCNEVSIDRINPRWRFCTARVN